MKGYLVVVIEVESLGLVVDVGLEKREEIIAKKNIIPNVLDNMERPGVPCLANGDDDSTSTNGMDDLLGGCADLESF